MPDRLERPAVTQLFIHIPKTAGMTLRHLLMERDPHSLRFAPDIPPGADASETAFTVAGNLSDNPAAVIGHWAFDAVKLAEQAHSVQLFTMVRDPLARMYSHYRFVNDWGAGRTYDNGLCWADDHPSDLPFTDFALHPDLQDFQTQYCGDSLSRFTTVGIFERLGAFVHKLGLVDSPGPVRRHLNRSKREEEVHPALRDPGFIQAFEEFHALDYALYADADRLAP